MKLKQSFFLLAGLTPISLASPGYAFDYKTYPGALCEPQTAADAVNFRRQGGSLIHNNAQQPLWVTCPIIRDRVPHENQPSDRTGLDVGVWLGATIGQSIECRFYSWNERAVEVYVAPQFTDPAQNLPVLFWTVSPEQTPVDGTYSIDCLLPFNIFLFRYTVGEDLETDNGF